MLSLIDQITGFDEERKSAAHAFKQLEFPARKEPYKYISLSKLFSADQALAQGSLDVEGASDEVVVLPLDKALKSYSTILKKHFAKQDQDPMSLLGRALMQGGVFIYVPPKVKADLRIIERVGVGVSSSYVHIAIGRLATAKVTMESSAESCHFAHVDCSLEEGSSLHMLHDRKGGNWEFESVRASLKRDSKLVSYHLSECQTTRSDLRASLVGENSSVTFKGLSDLTEKREAHQHILIEHLAPNTHSEQHFKTVLNDEARSSFEGKIYVESQAQLTRAYQLNNNLLLGDKVVANSKPNLEIFADDVKASHGTTMGQLSADELFYITSRGISAANAKQMLKKGFCAEILSEVKDVFT